MQKKDLKQLRSRVGEYKKKRKPWAWKARGTEYKNL